MIVTNICIVAALAAVLPVRLAIARTAPGYPVKPIRIVVAQEAGSAADNTVRTIAPILGEALGQAPVVDICHGAVGRDFRHSISLRPDVFQATRRVTDSLLAGSHS